MKYLYVFFRTILAAMHFNENSEKRQIVNKSGESRWQVSYPKYKKDGGVVKPAKAKYTYGNFLWFFSDM